MSFLRSRPAGRDRASRARRAHERRREGRNSVGAEDSFCRFSPGSLLWNGSLE
jgi:hypothetical protein